MSAENKSIRLSDILTELKEVTNLSQRGVARLLRMDKNTLSNNLEKSLEDMTPQSKQKIGFLYSLVDKSLRGYQFEATHEILNAYVFKSYTGETDSIASALQQNKFDLETLFHIMDIAKQEYSHRHREESKVDSSHVQKVLQG